MNDIRVVREEDGNYKIVRTEDAITKFFQRLELRGRSPATLASYRSPLVKLAQVAEWLPCTEDQVIEAVLLKPLSNNSRAHMIRVLRSFFDYASQQWPGVGDPTKDITDIKVKDTDPRVLTREEVCRLVEVAKATDWQDYLLVLTFLDTSVRVGELAGIGSHSIRDRWLHVAGKVGPRRAPIHPTIAALLKEHAVDGVIWRNDKGEPLSTEAIKKRIRHVFEAAEIYGPRRGPHTLRHTSATRFIEGGGTSSILKVILGHRDIKQTEKYVTLAGGPILDEHSLRSAALEFIERSWSLASSGITTVHSASWHARVIDASDDLQDQNPHGEDQDLQDKGSQEEEIQEE